MSGLHVAEAGPRDAPLVVLVHGGMDRSSGMRAVVRRLAGELRVVVYDRRGYGRSRHLAGPFTVDVQVADLVSVLDGRPATVFGHSIGGDIALAAAQRHPDAVRAAGAYEPPMAWEPWWPEGTAGGKALEVAASDGPEAAGRSFMERMVGSERWARLPAATRAEREAEGVALVGELAAVRIVAPFDLDAISVPVLLAYGERCAPQHRRAAEEIAQRLRGHVLDVELVEVPGAGHGVHHEDPEALAELVRGLVARAEISGP